MKYKTIYADPPWWEVGGGRICRGAQKHYPLMKTDEICALPVREWTEDNAHLYLWVTNNHLRDGFKVIEAWGFRYVTMITWAKDRFGIGQYFRGQTEHCMFAVRGVLPYKVADVDGVQKRQQGTTLVVAPRGEHSSKPAAMRGMIEKVSYGPFLEMFARDRVFGWDAWGNQV